MAGEKYTRRDRTVLYNHATRTCFVNDTIMHEGYFSTVALMNETLYCT